MIAVYFQISANLYFQATLNGLGWSLTLTQYYCVGGQHWTVLVINTSTGKVVSHSQDNIILEGGDMLLWNTQQHCKPTIKHMNMLSDPLYSKYSQSSESGYIVYYWKKIISIFHNFLLPQSSFLEFLTVRVQADRQTGTNKTHENFSP